MTLADYHLSVYPKSIYCHVTLKKKHSLTEEEAALLMNRLEQAIQSIISETYEEIDNS
jgi:hypothetical protein